MARVQNFIADLQSVTADASAGTEFAVAHTLGVPPRGYIVCRRGAAANLYVGTTAWDSAYVYLKCDTSSATFLVLLFI